MATTRSRPRRPRKLTVARPAFDDAAWRAAHSTRRYVVHGMEYEDYAPAYRYGVLVADKHGKKTFAEVEPVLAEEWATVRGASRLEWNQARPAVQEAYAGTVRVRPVRTVVRRPAKARTTRRKLRTATVRTRKRVTARRVASRSRVTVRSRVRGDDRTRRGPQDRSRINVHESWEVRYWSKRLGVSPTELRRAVKSAGPLVKNVRRELGK